MIDLPDFKLAVMAEDTHAVTACLGGKTTTLSYFILTVGSVSLSNETDGQERKLATIVSNDDSGRPLRTVIDFCSKVLNSSYRSSYRPCLYVLQRWQALDAQTRDCRDSSSSHCWRVPIDLQPRRQQGVPQAYCRRVPPYPIATDLRSVHGI